MEAAAAAAAAVEPVAAEPAAVEPVADEPKSILNICDYVGYSQHSGECWVDTIQQIFFFTDGLKELTQPLFYNMSDEELHAAIESAVAKRIIPSDILTPVIRSIESARSPIVYNFSDPSDPPLIKATKENDLATVIHLLDAGTPINTVDGNKMTALIWAAYMGNESIVSALLEKNADVKLRDITGSTALMKATDKGHAKIVELLHTQMRNTKNNVPFIASSVNEPPAEIIEPKSLASIHEQGIKAMRDRFKNHYDVIRNKDEEVCLVEGPQQIRQMHLASTAASSILSRFKSKQLGEAAAKGTQDKEAQQARLNSGGKYTEENAGGNLMQELAINNILYQTFNLPFRAMWLVTGLNANIPIHAFGISMMHIADTKLFGGHATGFLKCKDKWYYYNDNNGLFTVSAKLVTALQTALNFNDGKKHDSICIKTVRDKDNDKDKGTCYLLSLNNVDTYYRHRTGGFNAFQRVTDNVTPEKIWTEAGWIDYNKWKETNAAEAIKIETTIITSERGIHAYYNVLKGAYCVVKYESPTIILNSAILTDDISCFTSILNDSPDKEVILEELYKYKRIYLIEVLLRESNMNLNRSLDSSTGTTLLILATKINYPIFVGDFLENETVDINVPDKNGMTALMWAVKEGYDSVVSVLLKNKTINTNIQDKNGMTALIWAAKHDTSTNMVDFLLSSRARFDVNMQDKDGFTALMWAVKSGISEDVDAFNLRMSTGIGVQDNNGMTALLWAISLKNKDIITILLNMGPDFTIAAKNGKTALDFANDTHDEEIIKLIKNAIDPPPPSEPDPSESNKPFVPNYRKSYRQFSTRTRGGSRLDSYRRHMLHTSSRKLRSNVHNRSTRKQLRNNRTRKAKRTSK